MRADWHARAPVFYADPGVVVVVGGGTGVQQYSTNVYTGRLRPEIQPLTLLYTIFPQKGTPFVYFLLTNGTPFTYLV